MLPISVTFYIIQLSPLAQLSPFKMAASMDGKCQCDFFHSSNDFPCSGEIIEVRQCHNDLTSQLKRYKCNARSPHTIIPEGLLLLFRSGLFTISRDTVKLKICSNHRQKLGTYFSRTSRRCCHPLHPENSKEKPDRGISCSMAKETWLHARKVVLVGNGRYM